MNKLFARRLVFRSAAFLLVLWSILLIVGRGVRDHPLPWYTAWLLPFGNLGWELAFRFSIRDGWDKEQVMRAMGNPSMILIDGTLMAPEAVDPAQSSEETWLYPSPYKQHSGSSVVFRRGVVVYH